VIQRGNNREVVFVADEDYQYYLSILKDACQKYQCDLHAYVLMTNHIHLLITPHAENSISKVMQSLGRYYVQYFNHQYRRTGTLWEGRYKATLLDSEQYLLVCSRYIELNPVPAGMVNQPEDYFWSLCRITFFNALQYKVYSNLRQAKIPIKTSSHPARLQKLCVSKFSVLLYLLSPNRL